MKQKHILNIGHARCGTTWLWAQLSRHPEVDLSPLPKEPFDFLETADIHRYIETYKQHEISANFHVMTWCLDQTLIRLLNAHTTHATIILSDPYRFIDRLFQWIPQSPLLAQEFVDICISTKIICYKQIVERWSENFDQGKFKILLYDDLAKDPDLFLSDYFSFLGLSDAVIPGAGMKINVNVHPNNTQVSFSAAQIDLINHQIMDLQPLIDRDLSHWLR